MEEVKVMQITPERLRYMQLLQLDILKEFDRICRKHNIKYTLVGGSMLGAVRHKGFIPWDDDIDVSMLREDYNRFSRICEQELDKEKYFWQTMETDPEYRLIYGRILLNGTAYVRAGQEHNKSRNGIFIDVFPRDGRSDNIFFEFLQRNLAFLLRKTLYSPVGAVRNPSPVRRFVFRMLRAFPRSFAERLHDIIISLSFGKETERVACWGLMGNDEKRKLEMTRREYRNFKKKVRKESRKERAERRDRGKGLKRIFFKEIEDMVFEDMNAMVTKHYDVWLKTNYEDYMTLPPENKRKIHQTVSYYSFGPYEEGFKNKRSTK